MSHPDEQNWAGRLVLVTGGAGFLGGTLVQRLLEWGATVRVLDMVAGSLPGVEYCVGNITNPSDVAAAVRDVDCVYHLAARVKDFGTDADFWGPNVEATRLLADASQDAGVRQFVFMSSLAALDYRMGGTAMQEQSARTGQAMGAYGYSKRRAEWLLEDRMAKGAMGIVIVRPGMLPYGPGDMTSFKPMADAIRKRVPMRIGDGAAVINTAFAPELARGLSLAGLSAEAAGEILHLADPAEISWRSWYDKVARGLGVLVPAFSWWPGFLLGLASVVEPLWSLLPLPGMPPLTEYRVMVSVHTMHVSTEKARAILGYEAQVSLDEGLALTLQWYRSHFC